MPQGIYNLDWFAHNEAIKYPIDSEASFIPDGYDTLPSGLMGVITDISICSSGESQPYLSALTITDKMVTLVITVTYPSSSRQGYLIFSDIQDNIVPGRYYNLMNRGLRFLHGVICFGSGVKNHYCSYKFSSPEQSRFLPTTCNYFDYPVTELMVDTESDDSPFGDIKFDLSSNIVAKIEEITPQNGEGAEPIEPVKAITFSLNTDFGIDEIEKYLSICDARPENYSFPNKGILSIGGATPDENGNINIVFEDIHANSDSTGITILSTDYALEDICGDGRPPLEGEDECPYPPYIQDDPEDEEEPIVIEGCAGNLANISFKRDVFGSGISISNQGITVADEIDGNVSLSIPKLTNIHYCSVSVSYNPTDFTVNTTGYAKIVAYCDKGSKSFTIQPRLHEIRSNCMAGTGLGQKVNMRDEYNNREYGNATITFDACSNTITLDIANVETYTVAGELSEEIDSIGIDIRGKVNITSIQYK